MLSQIYSYEHKGSFKYFIGYISKGNAFPMLLCIKLLQMSAFAKYFDRNNSNLLKKGLIVSQCINTKI